MWRSTRRRAPRPLLAPSVLGAILLLLISCNNPQLIVPRDDTLELAIGVVTDIVDGDTLDISYVVGGINLPTRIRAYLINAPERGECYFEAAVKGAAGLLLHRIVWLRHRNRESFGRLLAFIYLDSDQQALFQAIMVSQGLAKVDVRHAEERSFEPRMNALQREAQEGKRGLWGICF